MFGLNLGSGQRPFGEGWINVDKVHHEGMPKPDLICDGTDLPDLWGNQFEYVCLHHVLEHFGCGEGKTLVNEAHRVLKPGGSLLVFVPDLSKLAKGWLEGRISDQIYMTNLYGAYMGHEEDRHRWGFSRNSLVEFLDASVSNVWDQIRVWDNPRIPGADIAWDWWILGIEAIK